MKILKQMFLIMLICLVGQVVSLLLPFPFPGSVAAMILLLTLLLTRVLKLEKVDTAGDFLVANMGFFLIPPGVGILEYAGLLGGSVIKLLVICVVTTALTVVATAGTVTLVRRLGVRRRG